MIAHENLVNIYKYHQIIYKKSLYLINIHQIPVKISINFQKKIMVRLISQGPSQPWQLPRGGPEERHMVQALAPPTPRQLLHRLGRTLQALLTRQGAGGLELLGGRDRGGTIGMGFFGKSMGKLPGEWLLMIISNG